MSEVFRFKDPLDALFCVIAGVFVVALEAVRGCGGWCLGAMVVYRFYRSCRVPARAPVEQEMWPLLFWGTLLMPIMTVAAVVGLETGLWPVVIALHFIRDTVVSLPLGAMLMSWSASQHRLEGAGELLDYFAAINLLVSAIGGCSVVIWLGFYLPQLTGRNQRGSVRISLILQKKSPSTKLGLKFREDLSGSGNIQEFCGFCCIVA